MVQKLFLCFILQCTLSAHKLDKIIHTDKVLVEYSDLRQNTAFVGHLIINCRLYSRSVLDKLTSAISYSCLAFLLHQYIAFHQCCLLQWQKWVIMLGGDKQPDNEHINSDDVVEPDDEDLMRDKVSCYSSGNEYMPSDFECDRKCSMCKAEVFIACPESSCLVYLCYDHRLTACSKHKVTDLSAAMANVLLSRLNQDGSSSENDKAAGTKRKRRLGNSKEHIKKRQTIKCEEKKNIRKQMREARSWHRVKSKKACEMGRDYISTSGRTDTT